MWTWPSSHDKPTTTLLRGHNEIEINCPSSRVGNDVPFFSLLAKTSTRDTRSSLFKFSRLLYHVSQSLRGLATAHYMRGASKKNFWQLHCIFMAFRDDFVMFFFLIHVRFISVFWSKWPKVKKSAVPFVYFLYKKNPHFAWKWRLIFSCFFCQTKNGVNPIL